MQSTDRSSGTSEEVKIVKVITGGARNLFPKSTDAVGKSSKDIESLMHLDSKILKHAWRHDGSNKEPSLWKTIKGLAHNRSNNTKTAAVSWSYI